MGMASKTYQICVFCVVQDDGREMWMHYVPRNCNTEWDGYMGTFSVVAESARKAGVEAVRLAKLRRNEERTRV
jgi:hypothetical protein